MDKPAPLEKQLCSYQETVLERLEARIASPLRVGRRNATDVGHVLQERREVVHLRVGERKQRGGAGAVICWRSVVVLLLDRASCPIFEV